MNKKDVRLAKKKILKCLTENFEYGKTKTGKPLKRPNKNIAIFDKGHNGRQVFNGTDLEMVMDAVVLGLYFALNEEE